MSETDSGTPSTMGEVISEPIEQQPAAAPVQDRAVSNEEAMIAQALSRIKKQAGQSEKTGRIVEQILDSLKKTNKERAKHSKHVEQQNKKILMQIAQLQKKIAKAKTAAKPKSSKKKKAGSKKR